MNSDIDPANNEMACDAGTSITRPGTFQGLDWETPCEHLPVAEVWMVDEGWSALLCPCHYQALASVITDLEPLADGEVTCQPGDSNRIGTAALS